MTGRRSARSIAGIFAVHAEIHVIRIVVVQYDLFEAIVEVVLQDFLFTWRIASSSARAAAAGSRFALSARFSRFALGARFSRFAWRVRSVPFRLRLIGRPFYTALLAMFAVRSASPAASAATTTAAGARLAIFVGRWRGTILCFFGVNTIGVNEFDFDRLFAPRFAHFYIFFRSAISRRLFTPSAAPAVARSIVAGLLAFIRAISALRASAFGNSLHLFVG